MRIVGREMKAFVRDRYGPPEVLEFIEMDTPPIGDGEILVRVRASSVNTADLDYLLGRPAMARLATGVRGPKNRQLGLDVAGDVERVGRAVTQFRPGDEVFGDLTEHGYGAFAEYACAPAAAFARKPATLSFEQAACVPQGGILALQSVLGTGPLTAGAHVLINGASGSVGPFAIQIAKAFGAEVTAVTSAGKQDLARVVGADHVIDYRTTDYTLGSERYDLIVDIAAHHSTFAVSRVLRPHGRYVWTGGSLGRLMQTMFIGAPLSLLSRKRMGLVTWKPFKADDVATLTGLIEAGKVMPVIDRSYPLDHLVEALRYQDAGKASGKLIIAV